MNHGVNPCGDPTSHPGSVDSRDVHRPVGSSRVPVEVIGPDGTWPMPPGSGPCRTWPLETGCGCLAPDAGSWDDEKAHAVEVATEILWRKTAGRFGLCHEIIRPCAARCAEPAPRGGLAWPDPNGTAPTPGSWVSGSGGGTPACGCRTSRTCGCSEMSEIVLPGPVYWEPLISPPDWRLPWRPPDSPPDLEEHGRLSSRYRLIVWLDGKPLLEPGWPVEWQPGQPLPDDWTPAHGDYWLRGNRLIRLNGGTWPACQDITAPIQPREGHPDEAAGSFAVEYWRGTPVPPGGRRAVSILACELYKACIGDDSCRLPRGVTEIAREGITYTLMEPNTDVLSTLPEVAGWVASVNPRGMQEPSTVWSPDMYRVGSDWTSGGRSIQRRGWW